MTKREIMLFERKAQECTAFSIDKKEFQKLDNKEAIRSLIIKRWFKKDKNIKFLKNLLFSKDVKSAIRTLKSIDKDGFEKLRKYPMSGYGPTEILLYFLVDDIVLTNGYIPYDLTSGGEEFEIKSVITKKVKYLDGEYYSNFKLGGKAKLAEIIKELREVSGINSNEINATKIAELRKEGKLAEIEKKFRKEAFDEYFSKHAYIFVNNKTGDFFEIKDIQEKDIFIDCCTSGTIKPLIKI